MHTNSIVEYKYIKLQSLIIKIPLMERNSSNVSYLLNYCSLIHINDLVMVNILIKNSLLDLY